MKRQAQQFAFFGALVAGGLLLSCSNQGEGQFCSRLAGNNGNDDCDPGLACTAVNTVDVCCPYNRPSTVPACLQGFTIQEAGVDSQLPDTFRPDTSAGLDASDELANDTSPPDGPDSSVEDSSDSATD